VVAQKGTYMCSDCRGVGKWRLAPDRKALGILLVETRGDAFDEPQRKGRGRSETLRGELRREHRALHGRLERKGKGKGGLP